ncbi:glycerophosphodiester phosphodiesterase [Paenactinomyces guangxiensis]|uniref:Glycerophosphodiester phosphodiesterase n=2 Tax=Paenactinomyces guangxiensis TaxID=1490290 RepID=A0A7W2A6W6_9BACL|nr:glycerophosphodiester phosphodiesterase [Paenactinomyces guangxiensis]MBH8590201.1 glycerophosphodiester phosphodiesterase [Paenactinomyces guangxiensis]
MKQKTIWILAAVLAFIYLNNSSLLAKKPTGDPFLLAHRGLGQTFNVAGLTNKTCTAKQIYPPEHPYLENTIPSMRAAFKAGADIVEFDVHLTKDGKFAVFHDWTLDCRTEGTGVTRDHTMAELKRLDIGYGYTADGGKTFPFRGKGIGLMPSLEEVLSAFPDRSFLIHVKSNDPQEGIQLAKYLSTLPPRRLSQLAVYGGDEPVAALHERLPNLRIMSKASMKKCLIPYLAAGWTGIIPSACEKTQLHIPEKIAPWLWGWPNRFLDRMNDADTRVVIVGGGGGFSSGFDSAQDLKRLPAGFTGGIWTNRIDRIGPLLQQDTIRQDQDSLSELLSTKAVELLVSSSLK